MEARHQLAGQIINENFVAEAVDDLHTGIDDQDNMARPIEQYLHNLPCACGLRCFAQNKLL